MGGVDDQTQTDVDATGDGATTPPAGDGATDDKGGSAAESGKTAVANEYITGLLSKYDLDTPEALGDFIGELAGVKAKVGDHDIDDLVANKKLMQQYQTQWAQAEEAKKRESETPEETIERLSGEIKKRDSHEKAEQKAREEERENKRLITSFNTLVTKEVKGLAGVPKHLHEVITQFLGVDNPIHDIDLSNKEGIKKLVKAAGETFVKLEKEILEKAGKPATPPGKETPPVGTTAEPPVDGDGGEGAPKVKNLKDARRIASASLIHKLRGGGG